MNHWNWSEITQLIGLNAVSTVWWAHFQWFSLLPQPDRLVEWLFGLGVAVTLMAVNTTKVYYLIKDKRNARRTGKAK